MRKLLSLWAVALTLAILSTLALLFYSSTSNHQVPVTKTTEQDFNQPLPKDEYQHISECGCSRKFLWPRSSARFISSCSDEGTFYNDSQNVIFFTLLIYKTNTKRRSKRLNKTDLYRTGPLINLKQMRQYYPPGFTIRIYTAEELNKHYCDLLCKNNDLFWCDIRKTPSLGDMSKMHFYTWRFLGLADATVTTFHSRDLDSAVLNRDGAVVKEWMKMKDKIKKPFYVMRDNKWGHDISVLGGMWGGDNRMIKNAEEIRDDIIRKSEVGPEKYGMDQEILAEVLYKPHMKEIVAYDSYHCEKYRNQTMVRAIPVQRLNHNDVIQGTRGFPLISQICAEECRPSFGKNWTYC